MRDALLRPQLRKSLSAAAKPRTLLQCVRLPDDDLQDDVDDDEALVAGNKVLRVLGNGQELVFQAIAYGESAMAFYQHHEEGRKGRASNRFQLIESWIHT